MIAVVLFSMVITGLAVFSSQLFDSYGITYNSTSGLSRLNNISSKVTAMQGQIHTQAEGGSNDIFLEAATGVLGAFGTLFDLPGLTKDILVSADTTLGGDERGSYIPSFFITGIAAIVGIIIVLIVVKVIMKAGDI